MEELAQANEGLTMWMSRGRETKMKTLIGALVLAVGLVGCSSTKVYVDYDRQADFASYKTFSWLRHDEPTVRDTNPFLDSRIKNAIEFYLTEAGLVEDPEDPDILVTYFGESEDQVVFNTTTYGMGYGPGWGWSPYWRSGFTYSTTTPHTYTEGTLVIDIWDARTKKVIWRGSATSVLKGDPQKITKQVEDAVDEIVATWRYDYRRSGGSR